MITQEPMRTTSNAGGTTARACESCLKSRARWFCPADDAFLCHACDSSVHSANDLAARHKRVPLQTPTNNSIIGNEADAATTATAEQPTWHQGFQKKPRTPRHHPKKPISNKSLVAQEKEPMKKSRKKMMNMMMSVVPEMSGDEEEEEENYGEDEEHMVLSVPTFDPFDHPHQHEDKDDISNLFGFEGIINDHDHDHQKSYWDVPVFDDHDHDQLAEFATGHDVLESLLIEGTDEDGCNSSSTVPCILKTLFRETGSERLPERVVMVEEEEDGIESTYCHDDDQFDFWAIELELENEVLMNNLEVGKGNYYGCKNEEREKKEEELLGNVEMEGNNNKEKKRKIFLRLNYEEVMNSWFGSSPWTTGCRPKFDLERDGWPNCMGGVDPMDAHYQGGGVIGERRYANGGDDHGREARLSRYRKKRLSRLFSKKIRYEVRKLNAEKRPRIKGRFVKPSNVL